MRASSESIAGYLASRSTEITSPRELTITYYGDMNGYIKIYPYQVEMLDELASIGPSKSDQSSKQYASVCLPQGVYRLLIFVYLYPNDGLMIIDNITLGSNPCTPKVQYSGTWYHSR